MLTFADTVAQHSPRRPLGTINLNVTSFSHSSTQSDRPKRRLEALVSDVDLRERPAKRRRISPISEQDNLQVSPLNDVINDVVPFCSDVLQEVEATSIIQTNFDIEMVRIVSTCHPLVY